MCKSFWFEQIDILTSICMCVCERVYVCEFVIFYDAHVIGLPSEQNMDRQGIPSPATCVYVVRVDIIATFFFSLLIFFFFFFLLVVVLR